MNDETQLFLQEAFETIYRERHLFSQSFPWRSTNNAFWALIAEILLQRTTSRAALRAYEKFTEAYKTPNDLLRDPSKLEGIIGEIGILSRVGQIVKVCEVLVNEYGSSVPVDKDVLKELPGIGEYISSAVLVNLKGEPYVMIDSNISRTCRRLTGSEIPQRDITHSIEYFLKGFQEDPKTKNLALLDFSMVICRPGRYPKCYCCTLVSKCKYKSKFIK